MLIFILELSRRAPIVWSSAFVEEIYYICLRWQQVWSVLFLIWSFLLFCMFNLWLRRDNWYVWHHFCVVLGTLCFIQIWMLTHLVGIEQLFIQILCTDQLFFKLLSLTEVVGDHALELMILLFNIIVRISFLYMIVRQLIPYFFRFSSLVI